MRRRSIVKSYNFAYNQDKRKPYKLSVLITTLPGRLLNFLPNVLLDLNAKANGKSVQIIYLGDNRSKSVGEKRNDLLMMASGEYVVFVDDDDRLAEDYLLTILDNLDGSDCVVFKALKTINGAQETVMDFDINHGKNHRKHGVLNMIPGHITPIKREIAIQSPFPDKNLSEDHEWAQEIAPFIKSQNKIDKILYYYNFDKETSETRW